ncbi:MAG TPA: hypothetical protein PK876_06800, partial [Elusimicrobiota bacterium]|nr:hypothetical protein [Elusimicrobiota bacterium]
MSGKSLLGLGFLLTVGFASTVHADFTVNGATVSLAQGVTLKSTGTLLLNGGVLNGTSSFIFTNAMTMDFSSSFNVQYGSITISNNLTVNTPRFDVTGSTFGFINGDQDQYINLSQPTTFWHLWMQDPAWQYNNVVYCQNERLYVNGNVYVDGHQFNTTGSTVNFRGNISGTSNTGGLDPYYYSNGRWIIDGTLTQLWDNTSGAYLYDLEVNKVNGSTFTLAGSGVSVYGDLSVLNGVFNQDQRTITFYKNFTIASSAQLTFVNGWLRPTGPSSSFINFPASQKIYDMYCADKSGYISFSTHVELMNGLTTGGTLDITNRRLTVRGPMWVQPTGTNPFLTSGSTVVAYGQIYSSTCTFDVLRMEGNSSLGTAYSANQFYVQPGATTTLSSSARLTVYGQTYINGRYIIADGTHTSQGNNVYVNNGGSFDMRSGNGVVNFGGTSVDFGPGGGLYADSTGDVIQTPGAYYNFRIAGGTLNVTGLTISGMNLQGLQIDQDSVVTALNNVRFVSPMPANAIALQIMHSGTTQYAFTNHYFDVSATTNVFVSNLQWPGYVKMVNATGSKAGYAYESDPNNVVFWSTPSAVGPLTFPSVSTGSIVWSWSMTNDERGYNIKSTMNVCVNGSTITADTTGWIEDNLSPNTTYNRYVEAFNPFGVSSSNVVGVCTYARPPTGSQIVAVSTSNIQISWERNGNPDYTRWGLIRSTTGFSGSTTTLLNYSDNYTALTYTDSAIQPKTTYYYRIYAFNESNSSTTYDTTLSTKTPPIPKRWIGNDTDVASSAASWYPFGAPSNGDHLIFDTSSTVCYWDIWSIQLASITITSNYSSSILVTQTGATISIDDTFSQSGGSFRANSPNYFTLYVSKNFFVSNTATFNNSDISINSGYIDFVGDTAHLIGTPSPNAQPAGIRLSSGTLTLQSNIRTRGDITISSGTLYCGNNTLYVRGNWNQQSGGFFDVGTSTVQFYRVDGNQSHGISLQPGSSFYYLELLTSSTVQLYSPLTILKNLTISSGTFHANNNEINLYGDFKRTYGFFSGDSSTFTFVGGDDQIVDVGLSSATFNRFVVNKTGSSKLTADTGLNVDGSFVVQSGTFMAGGYSDYVGGDFLIESDGYFEHDNGTLYLDGYRPSWGTSHVKLSNGSRLGYLMTSFNITAAMWHYLQFDTPLIVNNEFQLASTGGSLQVYPGTYSHTINGNFRIFGSDVYMSSGNFTLGGAGTQLVGYTNGWNTLELTTFTVAGTSVSLISPIKVNGDLTIAAGEFVPSTYTVTVGGDFTMSPGTVFDPVLIDSGAVVFVGDVTHDVTMEPGSYFNDLEVSSGTWLLKSTVTVMGDFKWAGGDIDLTSGTDPDAWLHLKGNWNQEWNRGNLSPGTGWIVMDGTASSQTIAGGAGILKLGKINIASAGHVYINGGTDVSEMMLSQGTLHSGWSTHNMWGNFSQTGGTFVCDNSTMRFGGGNQTVNLLSGSSFYNMVASGTTLTANSDLWVANDFTLSTGTFYTNNQTITVAKSAYQTGGTFDGSGTWVFVSSSTADVSIGTFDELRVFKASGTLNAMQAIVTSGDVWISSTSVFNMNWFQLNPFGSLYSSGTLSNVATLYVSGSSHTDLFVANGSTLSVVYINKNPGYSVTARSPLDCNGNFVIDGGTFVAGPFTHTMGAGFYQSNGYFNSEDSTISLDGSRNGGTTEVRLANGSVFNNLDVNFEVQSFATHYLQFIGSITVTQDFILAPSLMASANLYFEPGSALHTFKKDFKVADNWWLHLSSGNFLFDGNTTQYVGRMGPNNPLEISSFTVAGTSISLISPLKVNGDLTIATGEFVPSTYTVQVGGDFTMNPGAVFHPVYGDTGTVTFVGDVDHEVTMQPGSYFNNLQVSSGTLILKSTVTVMADFTWDGGNLDMSSGAEPDPWLHLNRNWVQGWNRGVISPGNSKIVMDTSLSFQTISGAAPLLALGNIRIDTPNGVYLNNHSLSSWLELVQGTLYAGGYEHGMMGDFTQTGGTFASGNSTVRFVNQTYPQTITLLSGSSFYNLVSSGTSVTANSDLRIAGDFTLSTGTFHTNNQTITSLGNCYHSTGTLDGAGTWVFASSGNVSVYLGWFDKVRFINEENTWVNFYYPFNASGDVWVSSASQVSLNGSSAWLGGNLYSSGTLTGVSTMTFYGSFPSEVFTTNLTTFNVLAVSKTDGATLTPLSSLDINDDFLIQGGTFVAGNFSHYVAGDFLQSDGYFIPNAGSIYLDGYKAGGTTRVQLANGAGFNYLMVGFNVGPAMTHTLQFDGPIKVAQDFNLENTGTGELILAPSTYTHTFSKNFLLDADSGTNGVTVSSGNFRFDGSSTQLFGRNNSNTTLQITSFTVAGSSVVSVSPTIFTGDVTVATGEWNPSTFTHTVKGNFTALSGVEFHPSTGTISFENNAGVVQYVSLLDSPSQSFSVFEVRSSSVTALTDLRITGKLEAGIAPVSSTRFNPNGHTVYLGGNLSVYDSNTLIPSGTFYFVSGTNIGSFYGTPNLDVNIKNLVVDGGFGMGLAQGYNLKIYGDWKELNGAVNLMGSTVTFVGGATSNVTQLAGNKFGQVVGDGSVINLMSDLDIDGSLSAGVGGLNMYTNNYDVNLAGDMADVGTWSPSGTWTLDGPSYQSITEGYFQNLVIHSTQTRTVGFPNGLSVGYSNGTLWVSSYSTVDMYSTLLQMEGNLVSSGTFSNMSTMTFVGGNAQTVWAADISTFNNVVVNKTGNVLTAASPLKIGGNFVVQGGNFATGDFTHEVGGDYVQLAGSIGYGAGTIMLNGYEVGGTTTTVQIVDPFNELEISKNVTSGIHDVVFNSDLTVEQTLNIYNNSGNVLHILPGSFVHRLRGDFTLDESTSDVVLDSGHFMFDGAGPQRVGRANSEALMTVSSFTVTCSSSVVLKSCLGVRDHLNIQSGEFEPSVGSVTVQGNFTIGAGALFRPTTGLFIFEHATDIGISMAEPGANQHFNDFAIYDASVTAQGDMRVDGIFYAAVEAMDQSTFDANGKTIYLLGDLQVASGSTLMASGTFYFMGSNQIISQPYGDVAITFKDFVTSATNLSVEAGDSLGITGNWRELPGATFGLMPSTVTFLSSGIRYVTQQAGNSFRDVRVDTAMLTPESTLRINGDLGRSALGGFNTNGQQIYLAGDMADFTGAWTPTGEWVLYGGANQTINLNDSFQHLTFTSTGARTVDFAATLLVSGNVSISSLTTVDFNGHGGYFGGNMISSGTFTDLGVSTIQFNGASASLWTAPSSTFTYLQVNKDSTATLSVLSNLTVNNNLTISGGSMDPGASTHTVLGNFSITGGTMTATAGKFVLGTGTSRLNMASTSSQFWNLDINKGAFNLTLDSNLKIGNDLNFNSGTFIITNRDVAVGGDLYAQGTGAFTETGSTITFNGSSDQEFRASGDARNLVNVYVNKSNGTLSVYDPLTVTGKIALAQGNLYMGGNSHTLSPANFIQTGGNFTMSGGTITFSGGNSSIDLMGGTAQFDTVVVNKTVGQVLSLSSSVLGLDVNGNITLTNGTLVLNNVSHTFAGDFTLTGGSIAANSSTVVFDGDSSSNLSLGWGSLWNMTLSKSGTNQLTMVTDVDVNGDVTLNSGAFNFWAYKMNVAGDYDCNLSGNFSGTTAARLVMDGSSHQTVSGYVPTSFEVNSSSTVAIIDASQNVNDLKIITGTMTITGSQLNVYGSWLQTGGGFDAGTSTVTFAGGDIGSARTITALGHPFYRFEVNVTTTVTLLTDIETDSNFTLSGGTFNAADKHIYVDGNWTEQNGAKFQTSGSTGSPMRITTTKA